MKRDDELIRRLLIELVESPEAYAEEFIYLTATEEENVRSYHLELLRDSGFIAIQDEQRFFINDGMPREEGRAYSRSRTFRVTNDGQDFYGAIRSEGVWAMTKAVVAREGGHVALELVKALALGFAKKQLENQTGLKL